MELSPIKYKKAYDDLIAKQIIEWQYINIYKPILKILDEKVILNDNNIIIEAIKSGLIYYQDGAFYSNRKRFSNKISLELERLGAKYSKYRNAYMIKPELLPIEISWQIETLRAKTTEKVLLIQQFINDFLGDYENKAKTLNFDENVKKIIFDLQQRTIKNFQNHKIQLISPKLTDFRANEIAENYTNNLKWWIKDWTPENMVKMRDTIGQMAISGQSRKTITEYIEKNFGVDVRKAQFLARNESAIATTSYLQAKYKEEGFTGYIWTTTLDGRERPLHKKLNGKYIRFDDPPIIDERTGQRGHVGETYNCRCLMKLRIDKSFLENRRRLFEENKKRFMG